MNRGCRGARAAGAFALVFVVGGLLACEPRAERTASAAGVGDAATGAPPPWDVAPAEPAPRPGMAWIPPGVLIAGTPPDALPRVADEEMAGEQVVMGGFYVDLFLYPNEAGAIPTTSVTQAEARAACEAQNKRLCTELELERACKGPANTTYEYGNAYKASVCGTGTTRVLVPNGVNASCESAFGVHDLHGSVWSWTSSQWRRDPAKPDLVTVRGGNGPAGDLVGRCANGRGLPPDVRRDDVGFRCCAGETNSFEVVLQVVRGEPLVLRPPDERVAPELERLAPEEITAAGVAARGGRPEEAFRVERTWLWHPVGNEELVLGGGCAVGARRKTCGVVIARVRIGTATPLAFVATDRWQPTVSGADSPRELHVQGGDDIGAFRRVVTYDWGRIVVSDKQRKKRRKGQAEASYD